MVTGQLDRSRWVICALLFAATTLNYIDRQVLALLAIPLERVAGWSEADYGFIVTAFQAAYAISLAGFGRIIDRIGTRLGYTWCITVWSVAAIGHAFAGSAFGFGVARFALGLGEAGNFPAAIKAVAEWFPKSERALATGLFNSGANAGAILGPLMVPWIAMHWGWRWAFVATGALGFLWIGPWLFFTRPRASSTARRAGEPIAARTSWVQLFPHRATWALIVAKFLTDPVWWIYLYWIPKFLNHQNGLRLDQVALPLIVIYLSSDVGSIAGGWLSSFLLGRGWQANAARKTAMLACAIAVTPIALTPWTHNVWVEVMLIGLAAAGHQGWSANLYTLASDVFPKQSVASVVGLAGFAGSVGGMLASTATGLALQFTGSYMLVFLWGACAYLIAITLVHWIEPKFQPLPEA